MNYKNPLKLAVGGCHYALSWQWQGIRKRKMTETFGVLWLWEVFHFVSNGFRQTMGKVLCLWLGSVYLQILSPEIKSPVDKGPARQKSCPDCQLWVWLLEGQVCAFAPTLYGSLKAPFAMARIHSLILFNLTLYFEQTKYEESASVMLDVHIQITSWHRPAPRDCAGTGGMVATPFWVLRETQRREVDTGMYGP